MAKEIKKEQVLRALADLAFAKPNNAVELAFADELTPRRIQRMELSALAELRRVSNGTVELKFVDRVRALTALYELISRSESGDGTEAFFRALEQAGESAAPGEEAAQQAW